jgi:formylglycine-generating enzyme required for sulfatase activity
MILIANIVALTAGRAQSKATSCNPQPLDDDYDYSLPLPEGLQMVFRPVFLKGGASDRTATYTGTDFSFSVAGTYLDDHYSGQWYYLIGKYEVTERQWNAVMAESSPSATSDLPKRNITRTQISNFTDKFYEWAKLKGYIPYSAILRCPNEGEWQFAARGGSVVPPEAFGQAYPYPEESLSLYEWFKDDDTAGRGVWPIGKRKANPLGLHDMIGNVREFLDERMGLTGDPAIMGGSYKTEKRSMGIKKGEIKGSAEDIGFRIVYGAPVFDDSRPGYVKGNPIRSTYLLASGKTATLTPQKTLAPTPSPLRATPAPAIAEVAKNIPPRSPITSGGKLSTPRPLSTVEPAEKKETTPTEKLERDPIKSPLPAQVTNSIGMQFVAIEGLDVHFCTHKTRRQDYQRFIDALHESESLRESLNIAIPVAWEKLMVDGTPIIVGPDYPVVKVSWQEANAFCRWLSIKEKRVYRLPTAGEWFTARGGGSFPWGNDVKAPSGALDERLLPVMQWQNPTTKLFDVGTNVQEWSNSLGQVATETSKRAIVLGHGWRTRVMNQKSFMKSFLRPPSVIDAEFIDSVRQSDIGFRCVLER